ncbi:hypothetical protein LJB42_004280 [Komagataella kurtzmanii]|nr:hypothetical protein LJB42_004280 [Komagataella kurtzmanii]
MARTPAPRVIFVRHGQTEWSKSGQYTSHTDLPLTPFGVKQMDATGKSLVGNSNTNLIQPRNLKLVITSPRKRAIQTKDLLLGALSPETKARIPHQIGEDIREWEYGDYEGLKTKEIYALRKSRGLDQDGHIWQIWPDGCENGETFEQVTERIDNLIKEIRKIHKKALDNNEHCDILVVAHGHILRCFAARWCGHPINENPQFVLDAGGVGVLSYQHHNVEEPALQLAGAFVVPVEEAEADRA